MGHNKERKTGSDASTNNNLKVDNEGRMIIGDHTTVIENRTINVFMTDAAINDTRDIPRILQQVSPNENILPPITQGSPNENIVSPVTQEDESYDDVAVKDDVIREKDKPGEYEQPNPGLCKNSNVTSKKDKPMIYDEPNPAMCTVNHVTNEKDTEEIYEEPNPVTIFRQKYGRPLVSIDNNVLSLDEKIDAFCKATSRLEQKRLSKTVHAELNNLSVELITDCKIFPAEYSLRMFLLEKENFLNVNNGIDIYASILSVMLKHGLQPQLRDKAAFGVILSHLEGVVEPPKFFPMSRVRRDIEAVVKMLSVLPRIRKKENINNAIELIGKLRIGKKQGSVNKFLEKYLKYHSWTQHYLVLSWLKMQTLVLKKPDSLVALLEVVSYLSKSLKKAKPNYRWKFTLTVVDSLVQIAREVSAFEMPNDAINGLLELFSEIQEGRLCDCIDIFHQRARILVFIDNLRIRSLLMDGIFKTLDTTAEEICKARIKRCTDLKLNAIRELVHNGSHSLIFSADFDSLKPFKVIVKCRKQTRMELIEKHADPHPKHFDFECRSLNSLCHPNIVKLLQYDERAKCVVLEFVSNGNLLTVLRNRRSDTLAPKLVELLSMAVQIAGALKFLKEKNIIHLAMQLRNVLLHENNVVKLTGFQFCRTLEEIKKGGLENAIEQKHFKWLDPQALLFESVSPKTVSWSLGVFLYELLTLGCVPFNHPERRLNHGDFKRGPLTSYEARIFVIRGGKLRKESCIPDEIFAIISDKCLEKNYSIRATLDEIHNHLEIQLNDQRTSQKIYPPPPRLIRLEEDEDLESRNPGTNDYDDNFPFAHLDVLDHPWNMKYLNQAFEEGAYSNADPSQFNPLLCNIKRRKEGKEWRETCVLEYIEFNAIKHVEKLQKLVCPLLLKVMAINRFGPDRLEMISESFPMGNILDALLQDVMLRNNIKLYIHQAGSAIFYLHEHRIVHRNIRIENYLMDNEGRIKLGYLGTSIEEADVNAIYMDPRMMENIKISWRDAPEVQKNMYSSKSDIWSFGVVVWQFLKLATTEPLITWNDSPSSEMVSIVPLPNPYPQPCSLYELCKKCWEWDAKDRPDMFDAIEEVSKSDPLELRQFSELSGDITNSTELCNSPPSNEDPNFTSEHIYWSIRNIKCQAENEDIQDRVISGNTSRGDPLKPREFSEFYDDITASTELHNSDEDLNFTSNHIYSSIKDIKREAEIEDVEDRESSGNMTQCETGENISHHETACSGNRQFCSPVSGHETEEDQQFGVYDDVALPQEIVTNGLTTPVEIVQEDVAMNIGNQGHVKKVVKYFTFVI